MDFGDFLPFIIGVILTIIPTWRIIQRTGFNPFLSLLIVVPAIGPLIVLIVLAFGDWPAQKSTFER